MNNSLLVSIIISTRDKPWSLLSKTLDSILSSTFRYYEVILVDQNNDGKIESEIRSSPQYSGILYINSSVVGLSAGRNLGLKHAKGPWVLFFDDDAIMPADTLSVVSGVLSRDRNSARIYCGTILTLETKKPYLRKSVAMGGKIGVLNFDSVCSIALFFNKRIFNGTGLFDEMFGAGAEFGAGEESDIILRALKKGVKITTLEGFIVYHPSAHTLDLEKRRAYGRGVGALYKKHCFTSLSYFISLSFKMVLEVLLRISLIVSNIGSAELRQYHLCYMRGFVEGFLRYSRRLS